MPVLHLSRQFDSKRLLTRGFEALESRRLLHGGADLPANVEVGEDAVPHFALMDANPASPTFAQSVSPRDYLGQISAWMFGYST